MTGNAEIFIISVEGGAPRNLTDAPSFEAVPSWSRDGKWIYFNSNRSGSAAIWKQPVEGGAAIQVTHKVAGALEGFEAPDGQLFYFAKSPGGDHGLWTVPVAGGEEQPVPELSQGGYWRSWGVVEQGIYFIAKAEMPRPPVKFFSFATRKLTTLVTVEKPPLFFQPGLALSPDGRALLYAQKDHGVNDIMLVENFR